MRRQLKECAYILLTTVAAFGCSDRTARQADTPKPSVSVSTGDTAVAVHPAAAASSAGAPRPLGPPTKQPSPRPVSAPTRDSLTRRVDSTTTTSIAQAPAPTLPPSTVSPTPAPSALSIALAKLPFGDKERLEYQVKYGFLGVGSAVLEVLGLDSVRGTPAVHATFTVKGGIRVYRVNDSYESWFDPASYATLRAVQNIDEGSYDRQRDFEFFPDRKM